MASRGKKKTQSRGEQTPVVQVAAQKRDVRWTYVMAAVLVLLTVFLFINSFTVQANIEYEDEEGNNLLEDIDPSQLSFGKSAITVIFAPVNGYVCLFTTAVSADFKDVSFRYLDENGGYTNHIPAECVTLQETSANVYIGDQVTLKADILPADASTKELSYASSDLSVAIVSESGVAW